MKLHFQKLDGAGNDFVGLDWRGREIPDPEMLARLTRALCDRHHGIGADGLLLIADEAEYDFRLVYLNRDGSRAEMCGNGARCAAIFAREIGAAMACMKFQTDSGLYRGEALDGAARVSFPDITALPQRVELEGPARSLQSVLFLEAGVPHAMVFSEDLDLVDVDSVGREIRFDPAFAPRGTNANFCEERNGELHIRTYERGVEGETQACGTGAVAAACTLAWKQGKRGAVEVPLRPTGDIPLVVNLNAGESGFSEVLLTGPARIVFEGHIELNI